MSRKDDDRLGGDELKLRFLETKKRLSGHLREFGRELEHEFSDTVDKASTRLEEGVGRASSNVAQAVTDTVGSVSQTLDQTVDRLKERFDVRAAIVAKPLRNVGISVAAGFGIALMLVSRRRNHVALPAPVAAATKGFVPQSKGGVLLGALLTPALMQLARSSAGYFLESLVEASVRRAHEGLEARSPRYAKAASVVRHHAGQPETLN